MLLSSWIVLCVDPVFAGIFCTTWNTGFVLTINLLLFIFQLDIKLLLLTVVCIHGLADCVMNLFCKHLLICNCPSCTGSFRAPDPCSPVWDKWVQKDGWIDSSPQKGTCVDAILTAFERFNTKSQSPQWLWGWHGIKSVFPVCFARWVLYCRCLKWHFPFGVKRSNYSQFIYVIKIT